MLKNQLLHEFRIDYKYFTLANATYEAGTI